MTDSRVPDVIAYLRDHSDKAIGRAARTALVSKLKNTGTLSGAGKSIQELFFDGFKKATYEDDVVKTTQLDDNWWQAFGAAVVAQTLYQLPDEYKDSLNLAEIEKRVSAGNDTLWARNAVPFYVHVFQREYQGLKAQGLATAQSAAQYMHELSSDAWIMRKRMQYNDGNWEYAAWELFHHWVKLEALGVPGKEVDAFILMLKRQQLPIPSRVDSETWRSYTEWAEPAFIDSDDLPDLAVSDSDDVTKFLKADVAKVFKK